jgi:hypothetical protein
MKNRFVVLISIISISLLFFQGCSTVQGIMSLQQLTYSIESIESVYLGGVSVGGKKAINDFSVKETLTLALMVSTKKMPLRMTVNIAVKNPNKGMGESNGFNGSATLKSMDWRLLIDDIPTINGNLSKPFEIPGNGQTTIVPLEMSVELYEYLEQKGYEGMANLALAVSGLGGGGARLKIDALPTVSTFIGDIQYPNRITIVDKEFR